MQNKRELGRIKKVRIGSGGYQGAMFGVSFELGGEAWGVGDFWGRWCGDPSDGAQWTLEDQTKDYGEVMRRLAALMADAKVNDAVKLVGAPVEVTFNGNALKNWRILTEVI